MPAPISLRPEPLCAGLWLADGGGFTLALGLHWAPLLGRDVARLARQRARALGASFYVWSGREQASVGSLRAPRRLGRTLGLCQSAALHAQAAVSGGAVALLLETPAQGCWLVAWHDHAVIAHTDCVYPSTPAACQALDALRGRYPDLVLYGNLSLPGMTRFDWSDMPAQRQPVAQLRRVRSVARGLRHAGWCVALLAAVGGGLALRRGPSPAPPAAGEQLAAWHAALAASVAPAYRHAPEHLAPLLVSLTQLPLQVTGWTLKDASCLSERADWLCRARYQRGPLGRNRLLADVLPPGWQLRVDLLDGADLAWRLPGRAAPLAWQDLRPSAETELGLASRLQTVAQLFSRIRLSPWQALPVEPPRHGDGRTMARPEALPVPGMRELLLEGPLHAFALLPDLAFSASWRRLHLQILPAGGAGLVSPRAQLSLQGWLYEKQ